VISQIKRPQSGKMNQLALLMIIFVALFLAQTSVFTYLLFRLRRVIKKRAEAGILEERGEEGTEITGTELKIMNELKSSGLLSARELSRRLGLSREHVARTLKKLVEEGLLIREGKPYKYKLTDIGRKALRSRDITSD